MLKIFLFFNIVIALVSFSSYGHSMSDNSDEIKRDIIKLVEYFLTEKFKFNSDINFSKELNLTPILGGQSSSSVFKLNYKDKEFIVRELNRKKPLTLRKKEAQAFETASLEGTGPKVWYVDQNFKIIIVQYFGSHHVSTEEFSNTENIRKFAKQLRKMHSFSQVSFRAPSPFTVIKERWQRLLSKNKKIPEKLSQLYEKIVSLEPLVKKICDETSYVHYDLINPNIFNVNSEYKFVDWSTSGLGEAMFDLSFFATIHNFKENQIHTLLKEYLDKPLEQDDFERFYLLRPISIFLRGIAGFAYSTSTDPWPELEKLRSHEEFEKLTSRINAGLKVENPVEFSNVIISELIRMTEDASFKTALANLKKCMHQKDL